MYNKIIKSFVLVLLAFCITACGIFEKDNTPTPKGLVPLIPEVAPRLLWSTHAGAGVDGEYLKEGPAVGSRAVYTSSTNGTITSIDKISGTRNWQVKTHLMVTTGPGIGEGIVVVGSRKGNVVALEEETGQIRWQTSVPGEILAKPAVGHGLAIIKTLDGSVRALSIRDGSERWSYQQIEPNLILRGSSAPLIRGRQLIVGFANGTLVKLSASTGQLFWAQSIAVPEGAFAIQRMIDIDADPIVYEHHIYAATYQGKIASLDWVSGKILWSHDISSYTGMIADDDTVYISDAKSHVWAFTATGGLVNWRQNDLEARIVTGPALMGDYVVVGDAEGYLHWLSKSDGHFAGRVYAKALYAAPIVDHNVLYVLSTTGYLSAYVLS